MLFLDLLTLPVYISDGLAVGFKGLNDHVTILCAEYPICVCGGAKQLLGQLP
jgi:hypothetical protein